MTSDRLNYEYFNWIWRLVEADKYTASSFYSFYENGTLYSKVLKQLYESDFNYVIPMDGNRADDGINLRYRFGRETGCGDRLTSLYLDYRPCSVLEMMTALALRCEENIMDDPEKGNRVGYWFWIMMKNLVLTHHDDYHFKKIRTDEIIQRFITREYSSDGRGGLFWVPDCKKDMRSLEIWDQMCLYLNYIMREENGK